MVKWNVRKSKGKPQKTWNPSLPSSSLRFFTSSQLWFGALRPEDGERRLDHLRRVLWQPGRRLNVGGDGGGRGGRVAVVRGRVVTDAGRQREIHSSKDENVPQLVGSAEKVNGATGANFLWEAADVKGEAAGGDGVEQRHVVQTFLLMHICPFSPCFLHRSFLLKYFHFNSNNLLLNSYLILILKTSKMSKKKSKYFS